MGRVQGYECGIWERGLDCNFNEWWYWAIVAFMWFLTSIPFLLKLLPCRAHAPSGASRRCMLLTTCSALLSGIDAVLYLGYGKREKRSDEYGLGTLSSLGGILLMFALRSFAYLWCDISAAFAKLQQDLSIINSRKFTLIRRGYDIVAFGHIPFALLMSISDWEWGIDFDKVIVFYMMWTFISLFMGLTFLACGMWCIARKIEGAACASNLVKVTRINFWEQMLYDICLLLIGVIYAGSGAFFEAGTSGAYGEYGLLQAVVHVLMFLLTWLLHVQVFIFFYVCDPNDPFYSQEDFEALLLKSDYSASKNECELEETIGSVQTDKV